MRTEDWAYAIQEPTFEHRWTEIRVRSGGHSGVFRVSADAVKVRGVRATCTAEALQQLADQLDAVLLTSKLFEQRWRQAELKLPPAPGKVTKDKDGTAHTRRVDKLISERTNGTPAPHFVADVGKTWILDECCTANKAVNHGWIVPAGEVVWMDDRGDGRPGNIYKPLGLPVSKCSSIRRAFMVQNRGGSHDVKYHLDYSQIALLCHGWCEVDGERKRTADVYTDPELCKLVTYNNNPLPFSRQPGVSRLPLVGVVVTPEPNADEAPLPWQDPSHTLGARCIAFSMNELKQRVRGIPLGSHKSPRISTYLAECRREGKKHPNFGRALATTGANWCAAFYCYAELQSRLDSDPSPPIISRCSGIELEKEAMAAGTWRSAKHVRDNGIAIEPGDGVILKRGNKGWQRHVCRFVRRFDANTFQTIGGNEGDAIKLTPRRFDDPDLLGFISVGECEAVDDAPDPTAESGPVVLSLIDDMDDGDIADQRPRISQALLQSLGVRPKLAERFAPQLREELPKYGIDTPLRVAHFLAQVLHESGYMRLLTEGLHYTAEGLLATFGKYFKNMAEAREYAGDAKRIANRAYANRNGNGDEASGDGYRYRGRGLIQLTGKRSYKLFADWLKVDVVAQPQLVARQYAVQSAVFFWEKRNLNAAADTDDVLKVTKLINGGTNGLAHRMKLLEKAKKALLKPHTVEEFDASHTVTASWLNLRSHPEVRPATRITALAQGTPVAVIKEANKPDWVYIRVRLGEALREGYVSSKHLKELEAAPFPAVASVIPELRRTLPAVHMRPKRYALTATHSTDREHPLCGPHLPPYPSGDARERAEQLVEFVRYLDPERAEHMRYQPGGGTDYCSIYAYDYAYMAGAYLPRVWWSSNALRRLDRGEQLTARYGATVREMSVNALFDWLIDFGAEFGWRRESSTTVLQAAANNGQVCLIIAQHADLNRSGHIALVVPEHGDRQAVRNAEGEVTQTLESQAGRTNHNFITKPTKWWRHSTYRSFAFWRYAGSKPALVDINSASEKELEPLPEIGLAKARKIVEYRTNNKPFTSVDELSAIDGINTITVEGVRDLVTIWRSL